MFKVNDKNTRKTSLTNVDFEQVNVSWDDSFKNVTVYLYRTVSNCKR